MTNQDRVKILAWTDLETTSVDEPLHVLEVAMVVTDTDLNTLASFTTPVKPAGIDIDMIMLESSPDVQELHTENGLWDAAQALGVPLQTAENYLIQTLRDGLLAAGLEDDLRYQGVQWVVNMAGSGVERFDRAVVARHMPRLSNWLHYASLDVSSARNLVLDLTPSAVNDRLREHMAKDIPHRAMGDVEHHMETARILRDIILRES